MAVARVCGEQVLGEDRPEGAAADDDDVEGAGVGPAPVGSLLRSASSRPLQTYRPSTSLVKSVNCAVLAVIVLLDTPRVRTGGPAV